MAKYRSSGTALAKTFEHSASLVYLIGQDWTVRYANPACATWLEVELDSLFGRKLDYASAIDTTNPESQLNGLSPPPNLFAESNRLNEGVRFLIANVPSTADADQTRYRWATAYTIVDANRDDVSVIVISQPEDLTTKPDYSPDSLVAVELHAALIELRQQSQLVYRLDSLIGISPHSARLRRQATLAANCDVDINIFGPPGSGREHLARTIHAAGSKALKFDLTPIQGTLADADLIRKVFEGFSINRQFQGRRGELGRVNEEGVDSQTTGAILFLNVDQLSPSAQAELYSVFTANRQTFRILSTGQSDLNKLAKEGQFHLELAAFLCPMTIELVPLWQRAEDIPLLAQAFLEKRSRESQVAGFDPTALQMLSEFRWPGNLDQLATVISQSGEQARDRLLTPNDLPKSFHNCLRAQQLSPLEEVTIDLDRYLESIEQELILRAVGQTKGNKTQAARLLGLSRAKLLRRIEYLNLGTAFDGMFTSADDQPSSGPKSKSEAEEGFLGFVDNHVDPATTKRLSSLRHKLLGGPKPQKVTLQDDNDNSAESTDSDSDNDWLTPDAFEEVD